jgi:hypothetical protein
MMSDVVVTVEIERDEGLIRELIDVANRLWERVENV